MLYLLLTLLLTSPDAISNGETVEWLQPTDLDLGLTEHGVAIDTVLRYRNLTEEPLIIENIRVGCGCTATEWEETPVAPGEVGSIKVSYDAAQMGYFRKYIKVFFYGVRGGEKLWIEGEVE